MAEKENFAVRLDSIEERFEVLKGILETTNLTFAGRLDEITKEIREIRNDIQMLKEGNSSRKDNDLDSIEVGNGTRKVKVYFNRKEDSLVYVKQDLENTWSLVQDILRKMEAEK